MADNDSPPHSDKTAALRKAVLAEVRLTPLGRALLRELGRLRVNIVFTDNVPGGENGNKLFGLFDPRINTLFVDANAPRAAQLHFFAHEARHALQMEQGRKLTDAGKNTSVDYFSPAAQLYLMRLRELDADTFAVYFVAQHDMHTRSNHFAHMAKRGFLFGKDPYDRAGLYEAFQKKWEDLGKPRDLTAPTRTAADAFLQNTALLNTYNNFALHVWENTLLQGLKDNAQKPESSFSRGFSAIVRSAQNAQAKKKTKTGGVRDIFAQHAAAYKKILPRSRVPDYTGGQSAAAFTRHVCDKPKDANPWHTTNFRYERAMDSFNRALAHYAAVPAAANNNAQPAAAQKKRGPRA